MRKLNVQMISKVKKEVLLEKLKENRAKHKEIVKEAFAGYMRDAEKTLMEKLEDVRKGKPVTVYVHLAPPSDMTSAYDTVINMLGMTEETVIELGADEFRQFVEDEWDWTDQFLASNSTYSVAARTTAARKALGS